MSKHIERRGFRGVVLYLRHRDKETGCEWWTTHKALANSGPPPRREEPSPQAKLLRAYRGPRLQTAAVADNVRHCDEHAGFTDGCAECEGEVPL